MYICVYMCGAYVCICEGVRMRVNMSVFGAQVYVNICIKIYLIVSVCVSAPTGC